MECTNLVDTHQLLCPWFTVVFVLFCIYTPDNLFSRPIVNQGRGLFWILSDSNVSLEEQIWLTECIYLAEYFKLRKKKKKQVNKYQSFATMEPYLTNPGKKLDWPSKDTLESERIQNRPPPWLTIGLENRLSGIYMQNSTNTTIIQGHNS